MIWEEDEVLQYCWDGIGVCCSFFLINEDMNPTRNEETKTTKAQRSELKIDSL